MNALQASERQRIGLALTILLEKDDFSQKYWCFVVLIAESSIEVPVPEAIALRSRRMLSWLRNLDRHERDQVLADLESASAFFPYVEVNFGITKSDLKNLARSQVIKHWAQLSSIRFIKQNESVTKGLSQDDVGVQAAIFRIRLANDYRGFVTGTSEIS